jgi:tripartite-type tricarboxylate transporter receptor subunit TctC
MRVLFSVRSAARIASAVALVGLGAVMASGAAAQTYPDRRITFVVPYPAGGATDVAARLLATKLQESWKQTVVVENKSGGGGIVGNDYAAKAPADGYTVLVGITHVIQAPTLGISLPYDPFKDLAPVTQVAISPIVFVVPEQRPEKSMKEFIAAVKASPKGFPYGSFGNATTSHLYGELLKKVAGIEMTHVPYRGAAPLANDLIGGQVNGGFIDLTTGGPQLRANKLRALAVGGERRKDALPEVPTLAELGYPGFEAEGWVGVFVPAGTPKDIVKKLSDELARIIKSPDGAERLKGVGLDPVGNEPEAFAAVLRKDFERWKVVSDTAGVKAEQ